MIGDAFFIASWIAEIFGEYCAKGSRIGVRRQLQYPQWQDDEGGNHSLVEIRARGIEHLAVSKGKPTVEVEKEKAAP